MTDRWSIRSEPPAELALTDVVALEQDRLDAISGILYEEAERYPVGFGEHMPPLVVIRTASLSGNPIRARYFSAEGVAVLTPTLDVRGDLHRIVAAALVHRHPEAAHALKEACAASPSDTLFQGRMLPDREAIALIAAVKSRRESLHQLANERPAFRVLLNLAVAFLREVGAFAPADNEALRPGFLLHPVGSHHDFQIQPTQVPLRLAPPPARSAGTASFRLVDTKEGPAIARGVGRDLWVLPEVLLAEAVSGIFIVDDVAEPGCDIAGFASGTKGGPSDLVVESRNRREILYHEFGHALHNRFDSLFPTEEWNAAVNAGDYFGDSRGFIKLGVSVANYHPSLLEKGFVSSYASATMAEDIAELTEALFSGEVRLWSSIDSAPLLKVKVELMMTFLQRVHPAFTREYLEQLSTVRHAQERVWSAS